MLLSVVCCACEGPLFSPFVCLPFPAARSLSLSVANLFPCAAFGVSWTLDSILSSWLSLVLFFFFFRIGSYRCFLAFFFFDFFFALLAHVYR